MQALPGAHEQITPDAVAIRTYVQLVFDGMRGLIPVRMLPEKGHEGRAATPFVPVSSDAPRSLLDHALRAKALGYGLYVVPGTVAGRKARAADVLQMSTVLVDLDVGDIDAKAKHLIAHLGAASLDVASGGITSEGHRKRHLYWRLDTIAEGPNIATLCWVRGEIARRIGGDPHFASAHQPVRVAGSVHNKLASRAVEILEHCDVRYDLGALAEAVRALPTIDGNTPADAAGRSRPRATEFMTRRIREAGIDDATRFQALSSVIGHWLRQVGDGRITQDEAWTRVVDHNAALIVPPWSLERLRREFDALRKVDLENRSSAADTPAPLPHSEDQLAALFSNEHGPDWAYVGSWGRWLHWTGKVWRVDAERSVRECIRLVCRRVAAAPPSAGEARRLGAANTFFGVERIAQSDPRHAATAEMWDCDLEALNTPGGIIDLSTGELRPHNRAARITRMAGATPKGECPRWRAFLGEITGGDEALCGYLARIGGYCLTGLTWEHVFFIFHGDGANGKSTFVAVLRGILGDYATSAPVETFVAGFGERHPTELAGLAGARLVTAIETEEGRRWTESKIKTITGGDPIKARFMNRDFFEFMPQFKLAVIGNHKPPIRSFDEAMRRRIQLVPFEVSIPPERREPDYAATLLREEADGILAWAVAGLGEWRRLGLAPPPAVTQATNRYFEEEDILGDWLQECTVADLYTFSRTGALYANWRSWVEAAGEPVQTQNWFTRELQRRGFKLVRTGQSRGFRGIKLGRARPVAASEPE